MFLSSFIDVKILQHFADVFIGGEKGIVFPHTFVDFVCIYFIIFILVDVFIVVIGGFVLLEKQNDFMRQPMDEVLNEFKC